MVTQKIDHSLHSAEKIMDGVGKLANNGQEQSEEDIQLKHMEMIARKAVHDTLKVVSKIEGDWGKTDWGSNNRPRTEDRTW